jgi:hypothetical protein
MLLGIGGLGETAGEPSPHYANVQDTCVGCHMGDERSHTYLPEAERCQACHSGVEDFDVNGVQTEVTAMLEELHAIFVERGMLNEATDLWIVPMTVTEDVANAMWNYKLVTYDQSMGVHNADYTKALLESALEAMQPP